MMRSTRGSTSDDGVKQITIVLHGQPPAALLNDMAAQLPSPAGHPQKNSSASSSYNRRSQTGGKFECHRHQPADQRVRLLLGVGICGLGHPTDRSQWILEEVVILVDLEVLAAETASQTDHLFRVIRKGVESLSYSKLRANVNRHPAVVHDRDLRMDVDAFVLVR